jgi:hypothetical protein
MNRIILISVLTFFTIVIHAQDTTGNKPVNEDTTTYRQVFTKVEISPSFVGGELGWQRYVEKFLDQSIPKKRGAPAGLYRVAVQFIVEKDGSVNSIKGLTRNGYGMEAAAEDLIRKGPKWKPAVQNGRQVVCYHMVVVYFNVRQDE